MACFKGAFFVVEQRVVRRSGGVSQILKAFMFVVFVVASSYTTVTVFGEGDASRVRLCVG